MTARSRFSRSISGRIDRLQSMAMAKSKFWSSSRPNSSSSNHLRSSRLIVFGSTGGSRNWALSFFQPVSGGGLAVNASRAPFHHSP